MPLLAADTEASQRHTAAIHAVVIDLIESQGQRSVHIREVARLARVSPRTIYELYPSRDALIVGAVAHWMSEYRFDALDDVKPDLSRPYYERMMPIFTAILKPWESHPRMLEAFFTARTGPGGEQLIRQGNAAIGPLGEQAAADIDDDVAQQISHVMGDVVYARMGQFSSGLIAVTDILPGVDRALRCVSAGIEYRHGNR